MHIESSNQSTENLKQNSRVLNKFRGEKFIFIGGAPRSGTTLVQNIIDCHPDILGTPEYKINYLIFELHKRIQGLIDNEEIDLICTHAQLDENIAALIESFLNPLFDQYPCKLLSEKSPNNILVMDELIHLFPGAKYIHVIRDPRAVVSSLLEVERKGRLRGNTNIPFSGLREAIEFTKNHLSAGFKAMNNNPGKILVVIYENLVSNPEVETKRMCQYLGIQWNAELLNPGQVKHLGEKSLTTELASPWYDKESYYRDPESKEIHKWKKALTSAQQIRITKSFLEWEHIGELQKLGYDLLLNHMSFKDRLMGNINAHTKSRIGDLRLSLRKNLWKYV